MAFRATPLLVKARRPPQHGRQPPLFQRAPNEALRSGVQAVSLRASRIRR